MLERNFQSKLIHEIKSIFPGAIVLKTDPAYLQGFPDILILFKKHWAALEVKKSEHEHRQPNQEYYVDILGDMSYAAFIYPENKELIFHELQLALKP